MRKNTCHRILCLALILCALFCACGALAESGELPGVAFEIQNGVLLRINTRSASASAIPIFKIPEGVTEIGEEAFRGNSAIREVELGEKVSAIGPCAFADCAELSAVYIRSDTEIDGTAFQNSDNVVIHTDNPTVQDWAEEHSIPWVPITSVLPDPVPISNPIELPAL